MKLKVHGDPYWVSPMNDSHMALRIFVQMEDGQKKTLKACHLSHLFLILNKIHKEFLNWTKKLKSTDKTKAMAISLNLNLMITKVLIRYAKCVIYLTISIPNIWFRTLLEDGERKTNMNTLEIGFIHFMRMKNKTYSMQIKTSICCNTELARLIRIYWWMITSNSTAKFALMIATLVL